jgi:glucose-1-phosphate cytidylyltransferase
MKAVILAGGLGTRMREETEYRPKPMVEVGGKPVLWHIMKIFASQGVTDFVILTGYKGEMIKRFFFDYSMLNLDFTVNIGDRSSVEFFGSHEEDGWKVTVLDTGEMSLTGERLLRARNHLGDEPFYLTYGDGIANVNLAELLRTHRETGATLTISTSKPRSRFGVVSVGNEGLVERFLEKPEGQEIVNIGYMVANNSLFEYLEVGGSLEDKPLAKLAQANLLAAHNHDGFWQPMDTIRELEILNRHWNSALVPWQNIQPPR